MSILILEITIIISVFSYALYYAQTEKDSPFNYHASPSATQYKSIRFLEQFLLCILTAWILEESSILFYGFYKYKPAWNLFIGHVPVAVILVWPVIIHSSSVMASQLVKHKGPILPVLAAVIVLTDAMLIEPVSANSGLWSWNEPGLFGVPLVGIFGWAFFALFWVFLFEKAYQGKGSIKSCLLYAFLSIIGTHALLLTSWWGLFRWINIEIDPRLASLVIWLLSLLISFFILVKGKGKGVKAETLWVRVPAAIFFYILLFFKSNGSSFLIIYGFAFAPPYLLLLAKRHKAFLPIYPESKPSGLKCPRAMRGNKAKAIG